MPYPVAACRPQVRPTIFTAPVQPTLTTVAPASLNQSLTAGFTLTGTSFVNGCTVSVSGTGVSAVAVRFDSSTSLFVSFAATAGATASARNVTVTNPGGLSSTASSALTVVAMDFATMRAAVTTHYALNETDTAADATDDIGGATATHHGTISSVWQRNGRAKLLVLASINYFSAADTAANTLTGSIGFTIFLRAKFTSIITTQILLSKGAGDAAYWIGLDATSHRVYGQVAASAGFGGSDFIKADKFGAPAIGQELFVAFQYDVVANKIRISVNGSEWDEATNTGVIVESGGNLYLGCFPAVSSPADASVWDVVIVKDYLATQAHLTAIYNGGNVLRFEEWDAAVPTAMVSFSADESTATVAVSGRTTQVIPRPTTKAWAYTPTGATYYVDPSGDNTAAGTKLAPYRTPGKAVEAPAAGDLIYVNAGTYVESLYLGTGGSAGNPLILSCSPGCLGLPRLLPSTAAGLVSGSRLIDVNTEYVKINGLDLEGAILRAGVDLADAFTACGILWNYGGFNEATNCFIHHHIHCGVKDLAHGYTNLAEDSNLVFCNGTKPTDHGIYHPSSTSIPHGNLCFWNAGFGIHLYSAPDNCTASRNVCWDNGVGSILCASTNSFLTYNTGYESYGVGFQYFRVGCTGNAVDHNIFTNVEPGQQTCGVDGTGGFPSGNVDDYNDYYPQAVNLNLGAQIGLHDLNVDPQFVSPSTGDFRAQNAAVAGMGAYAP